MDESLIPLTPEETSAWGAANRRERLFSFAPSVELTLEKPVLETALQARLEKAMAEPDYEREEIFRYLKEFKKRKSLGLEHTFERQEEAKEKARAAVERMLEEDAERPARESEGTMSEETVMESAGVGIGYFEDENGKLTKRRTTVLRRTPTRKKTPTANGDSPARQFTRADRERVNKNRCRYTRAAWLKQMLAIAEGRLTVTKEQFQAFRDYGRSRGWHRRSPSKR